MLDLRKRYPLITIVYDPDEMIYLMQRLTQAGFRTEPFKQTPANLSALTQALFDSIKYGRLIAYPNPKLRTAMTRAIVSENSVGQRLIKKRNQTDKIDAVIALGMAVLRHVERNTNDKSAVAKAWYDRAAAWESTYVDPDAKPSELEPPRANQNCAAYVRAICMSNGLVFAAPPTKAPSMDNPYWNRPPYKPWPGL